MRKKKVLQIKDIGGNESLSIYFENDKPYISFAESGNVYELTKSEYAKIEKRIKALLLEKPLKGLPSLVFENLSTMPLRAIKDMRLGYA